MSIGCTTQQMPFSSCPFLLCNPAHAEHRPIDAKNTECCKDDKLDPRRPTFKGELYALLPSINNFKYKRDRVSLFFFHPSSFSNTRTTNNGIPLYTKQPTTPTKNSISAMSLFKSSKNQSASAASTPAQTPRSSMQGSRPAQAKMTHEQALQMALEKSFSGVAAHGNIRI